jgi:hypothetical protein
MTRPEAPLREFLVAALVPRSGAHADGRATRAKELLAAYPAIAEGSIHAAAVLGRDDLVRRLLADDPSLATAVGGPYAWDALTHLCFSTFLKDEGDTSGFVRAAEALLGAGASARTGFYEADHQPAPTFESALYGAAGVAHHPELTALLLAHGADPNDDEVAYHVGESYDNRAMRILVESGTLTPDALGTILVRKCDWHDADGVSWLLEHGVDPNHLRRWDSTALHHAIRRDNWIGTIERLLDHGADPLIVAGGMTCVQLAVRLGRRDVLGLFRARGVPIDLSGVDTLLFALAHGDSAEAGRIAEEHPDWKRAVLEHGGRALACWSLTDNLVGVRALLDLDVPATAVWQEGDGYWGIPRNTPALHVAAWLARHNVVSLLIARGADVHATVRQGDHDVTALQLAVRATVDSYWTERRSPQSVMALLEAGASPSGIRLPSGYDEIDRLL